MTTQSIDSNTFAQSPLAPMRRALVPGLLVVIAGAMQGDGALITAAHRGSSQISEEQLSFPWSGVTAVTTSLIWGVTQLMLVVGLAAFARSGAARSGVGQLGGRLAVAGALLYVLAHGFSVTGYDAALDDPIGVAVVSCFAVGTLLTAIGLILAGTVTLRSGAWSGVWRFTPLALGVWMVAMLPLQFTAALPVAVGVYAAATMAFGLALLVEGLADGSAS